MTAKVLLVLNKYYHEDPRVQRELAALLEAGYEVHVICPGSDRDAFPQREGLRFHRLRFQRKRGGRLRYLFEYAIYFTFCFFTAAFLQLRHRYRVVQVFVMPEALMLTALIPRLLGARIVMDWMDPFYEVYLAKFGRGKWDPMIFAIRVIERVACALAHEIITANEGFVRAFAQRGRNVSKVRIVMNAADDSVFRPSAASEAPAAEDKDRAPLLLFHGTLVKRHGPEFAVRALAHLKESLPEARLRYIGDGPLLPTLRELAGELGVADRVHFTPRVDVDELPALLAEADVGIISNRDTPFTRINLPTRIFELTCMRKPVICPRLPGILDYFDDDCLLFFEPEDDADLARCITRLLQDDELRERLVANAVERYATFDWEANKRVYLDVIDRAVNRRPPPAAASEKAESHPPS